MLLNATFCNNGKMKSTLTLIAIFVAFNLFGQDLIEFRGVDRSGYYPETGLLKQWPETGPELLLKIEGVGKGFSAPIVANSTIYVTGIKEDSIDILSAFNFKAELLWDIPYGRSWTRSYIDSRSTPTYSAPAAVGMNESMSNIGFKVAISQFPDETTMAADLVLPVDSYLEDWGTQVPANQAESNAIHVQQPLMERLHDQTKGLGDIVLSMLKLRKKDEYAQFEDYYAYLRNAFAAMPADVKKSAQNNNEFWNAALQAGVIDVKSGAKSLQSTVVSFATPVTEGATDGLSLVPSARMGLLDGRHANLPWLQEAPDHISKVVWDSWAEMHPDTAAKMGIANLDLVRVTSAQGSVDVRVVLLKGIHRDAVAVPLGQGHEAYGRYAKGLGVNPLSILDATSDTKTGELAMFSTRVTVKKIGEADSLSIVRMGTGSGDSQAGRKLVGTVSVEQLKRSGGA